MKLVRNLYDWVLSWAETRYGAPALFLLALAEASFFPIPPDVLLLPLCVGKRARALRFALICTVGSVVGGAIGYAIGWGAWEAVDQVFYDYVPGFSEDKFHMVGDLYEQYNFWVVFVAAFTPIPYKVITIAAGVFQISFPMFMIASIVGRAARFFLVAGLLYFFGEPIKGFIDRWFNLLVVVFTILLIGGFALLKYLH
jgi:membrane protein YqaA with SNARE-associated domain